ncbi:hypothetical protein [Streptomyces sp. NPDC102409]|uniref:hypothetical protein n=1 Tax=Streptomyces sp. NPDC102409 TaxID=3366172 RepID=UPI0037F493C8
MNTAHPRRSARPRRLFADRAVALCLCVTVSQESTAVPALLGALLTGLFTSPRRADRRDEGPAKAEQPLAG